MKENLRKIVVMSIAAFFLVLSSLSFASAQEYDAMTGVNSVDAIFDMRDGNPQTAGIHLNLIHNTYKELIAMKKNPVFVVVFMGSAVKLISSDRSAFSAEEQKSLKEIASIISRMSKAGIRVEVCLFAVKLLGVEPASILPEIERVGNGWISEIGYQARGYSLVPVY
jgi:intracellular sulfur oxidation DsrE/DsrF family protein